MRILLAIVYLFVFIKRYIQKRKLAKKRKEQQEKLKKQGIRYVRVPVKEGVKYMLVPVKAAPKKQAVLKDPERKIIRL